MFAQHTNSGTHIDLNEFIDDNIDLVEIFFCNKKTDSSNVANTASTINVIIDNNIEKKIEERYKKCREEKYKSYAMNEKLYTYELSNDNQNVTSKLKKYAKYIENKSDNIYVISSKINKFPQYTFPCTNDIDNICQYTIKEYKISNRVSLILRIDSPEIKSLSIEYRHSAHVEIDKINEIVNKLLKINK
jgi:septal ring factor EnvC (AmiA/AmiB activator)